MVAAIPHHGGTLEMMWFVFAVVAIVVIAGAIYWSRGRANA
jgi:hypothetical protein